MSEYGLQDDDKQIILDILKTYPQIKEVVLFGSRALNTFKTTSDVDLAIKGKDTNSILAALMADFEESDLIYEVDLVDYASINTEKLLEHIDQHGKVFYRKGWVEVRLGDISKVQTGPFGSQLHNKDYVDVGTPMITVEHIIDDKIQHTSSTPKVSDEDKERLSKYILKEGDIVFSRVGSVDRSAFVSSAEDGWMFSGRLLRVRGNAKKIYSHYLHYALTRESTKKYIRKIAVGATMPSINTKILSEIPIIIPPLPEQKAIANILSSFDEKIELLREQNKTLETLAQTIFKEWFVNFNYPGATGERVDSELGEIPEGWRVEKLSDEFDITIGRTPPRKESHWFSKTPTGMKWSSIKDMVNSGVYIFKTSEYITDEAIKKFNIPVIPENTVILSFKMTVGKLAITTEHMLSNEAIAHMKIKSNSYLTSEYIYLFLHRLDFNSLGSTSSIVTAINSTMIKQLGVLIPKDEVIKYFGGVMIPIFEKMKGNISQTHNLKKSRDILLPKLMSGQVRVF